MFTKREDEVNEVGVSVNQTKKGGSADDRLELGELESAAVQRHSEVVSETRWLMIEWIILLSINFVMHFMRMSVVMLYCIHRFGASEFNVGVLVTMHMLIMGLANSYTCHVMDDYSFESLMIVRFSLLTLATIGEYLADSFALFASIYCAASLGVVWFGAQSAYSVKMLPSEDAKSLVNIGIMMNQTGILLGLSSGGLIGGLIDMRTVFLVSCAVAFLSLLWILFGLRGTEEKIRNTQAVEISALYHDFPGLTNDANKRFPIAYGEYAKSHSDSMNDFSSDLNGGNMDDNFLCSLRSLPFWLLTIRKGLNSATNIEIVGWWPVYAAQVYDAPLEQSSLQFVIAILIGVMLSAGVQRFCKPQQMSWHVLLDFGVSVAVSAWLCIVGMFFFVFPRLEFSQFWLGLIVARAFYALTWPLPSTMLIAESKAQSAGKMFTWITASRSIIPATQHVIIGHLWSKGGSNHPWFFRWFGILHLGSALCLVLYYLMRRFIDVIGDGKADKYSAIGDAK